MPSPRSNTRERYHSTITTVLPDGTEIRKEKSLSTPSIFVICLFLIFGFVLTAVFMGWVDRAWALELLVGWANAIAIAVGGWF